MPGSRSTTPPWGACRCAGCLIEEITVAGDWAKRRPELTTDRWTMWAFEFANVGYPDIDDTAEVVLAMDRLTDDVVPGVGAAVERGVRWSVGMQSKDGGWGAFDADNTRRLVEKLPFCDFGAVIDPPSADVTAHMVEMLAHQGLAETREACRRGVAWLLNAAGGPDGSWYGRWGTNYVYGDGRCHCRHWSPPGSTEAILRSQRRSPGWRGIRTRMAAGARTFAPPLRPRRGEDEASRRRQQTAWALLALLAVDASALTLSCARSIECCSLMSLRTGRQLERRALHRAQAFPGDFYINYEMYRFVFPISALGAAIVRDCIRRGPGSMNWRFARGRDGAAR